MEELIRLSIEYYKNTVGLRFFGFVGGLYLLLSAPFVIASFYMILVLELSGIGVLPMMAAAIFWRYAKNEYNRNLVKHLTYYTHLESNSATDQKTIYLHYLTSHISETLHESMKNLQDIIEIDKKSKMLGFSNGWSQFKRFLYDPESKSRIVSLLIYLISIFALIIIIKEKHEMSIYVIVDAIPFEFIKQYFFISVLLIIIGYVAVVFPITFFVSFVIYPVLLKMSVNGALVNHFITEMNRYSFRERNIKLTKCSSGRVKGARR